MSEMRKNMNTEIEVVARAKTPYHAEAEGRIRAIAEEYLRTTPIPYMKARVRVLHDENGKPTAVILYLFRALTYTLDAVKAPVTKDCVLLGDSPWRPYHGEDEEEPQPLMTPLTPSEEPSPPMKSIEPAAPDLRDPVDMIFATYMPEGPTAVAAIERVGMLARAAGFRVRTYYGAEVTSSFVRKCLTWPLVAFGSIGHGNVDWVATHNGTITPRWLMGLPPGSLASKVIYLNSCLVFNHPFGTAMRHAGARTFIGGIESLGIGASEDVFVRFWERVLLDGDSMGNAIAAAEAMTYKQINCHGIAGDRGPLISPA